MSLTADQLTAAFLSALNQAHTAGMFNGVGGGTGGGGAAPGAGDSFDNRRTSIDSSDPTDPIEQQYRNTRSGQEFARQQTEMFTGAVNNANKHIDDVMKVLEEENLQMAKNYQNIYSGMGTYFDRAMLDESGQESLKGYVYTYENAMDAYFLKKDEFIGKLKNEVDGFTKEQEEQLQKMDLDFIKRQFESPEAFFNQQKNIMLLLESQFSTAVNQLDEVTKIKLPKYTEAMGMSQEEVAKIMERQLTLTGEMSTKIIDDIAAQSFALSEKTGKPMKLIQDQAVKIISNLEKFGPVTAQQATKMSAELQQLGLKFESLTGLMGKFQEFGGAASLGGDIAQLTGGLIDLDAQELMYLASEAPDQFLSELRNQMMSQGFDREQFLSMTQADQRAFAEKIGLERGELAQLLSTDQDEALAAISKAQQDAEAEGMLTEEAAQSAIDKQFDRTTNHLNNTEKMMSMARRREMNQYREHASEIIRLMQETGVEAFKALDLKISDDISMEPLVKALRVGKDGLEDFNKSGQKSADDLTNYLGDLSNKVAEPAKKAGYSMGENYVTGMDENRVVAQSLPPIYQDLVDYLDVLGKKGAPKAYLAGYDIGSELARGFTENGIDVEAIKNMSDSTEKTKSVPVILQKNLESLMIAVEKNQTSNEEKYQETFNKVIQNITELVKVVSNLEKNQESIVSRLSSTKDIILQVDGKEVGKAILERAPEIETFAGVAFRTEGI